MSLNNIEVSNANNKGVALRNKINAFYISSKPYIVKELCPTRDLLVPLTDKWSLLCLFNLGYHEVLRFNELQKYIPKISARMLSVTLKKLESKKIVQRKMYAQVPPKVEYTLTPFGHSLADKMIDLNTWLLGRMFKEDKVSTS